MTDHAHHHGHHSHGHHAHETHAHPARALAAPIGFSLLRLSVAERLMGVGVLIAALWLAVFAAVAS